jgi:hypothetical protein
MKPSAIKGYEANIALHVVPSRPNSEFLMQNPTECSIYKGIRWYGANYTIGRESSEAWHATISYQVKFFFANIVSIK